MADFRPIHPFPARMAPEIAIEAIAALPPGSMILDPMCGSGTVLRKSCELGFPCIGIDIDPLSVLHAQVWTSPLDRNAVKVELSDVVLRARADKSNELPPYIDQDEETRAFVDFWFSRSQQQQLSNLLRAMSCTENEALFRLALSRTIVTKNPKASLARDTAHSRPHKVLEDSEIDVIAAFESGVDDMAKRLSANHLRGRCEVFGGDARALTFLADGSIDAIITSPPYLNAIDYMRGHRLALVWLGQHLSRLRTIRGDSVGAERGMEEARTSPQMASFLAEVGWYAALSPRMKGVVRRYAHDVLLIAKEAARVLKTSGTATVVVGNSSVEGIFIPNSEIVSFAFRQYRLEATDVAIRHIPESKRYLPLANAKSTNSLSKRIRTESVTRFRRQ